MGFQGGLMEKDMATHSSILGNTGQHSGKSHGQRSLAGCSPWCHKRIRHDLATKQQHKCVLTFAEPFENKLQTF